MRRASKRPAGAGVGCGALPALLLAVGACAPACIIEPIDLGDKRCDADKPCVNGYVCEDGVCELLDGGPAGDGGDDDSGTAAAAAAAAAEAGEG